jgi:hypothetical protein
MEDGYAGRFRRRTAECETGIFTGDEVKPCQTSRDIFVAAASPEPSDQ